MKENTMHGFFILGLVAYGFFLIYTMGKQTQKTFEILNGAPMADMPPTIELRKENQNFVIYK